MLNYRVILFAFAFIFGVIFSIPSLTQSDSGKKITLGLDLQGGLHMLLGVKSEEAIKSYTKSVAATIKYVLDDEEIIYDALDAQEDTITFEILDADEVVKAKTVLEKELQGVTLSNNGLNFTATLTPEQVLKTQQDAINQAVETIRNRLDQFGLAEPTVAKQGEDKILVEIPGIKTAADEQRIRELIARAARLEMMAVDEERIARVNVMSEAEAKKYGDVILKDVYNEEE